MTKTLRTSSHDKVATRLAEILIRLNNGEKLDPRQLAKEFGVTLRTIQRDLLERLAFLPLGKDQQYFILESYYLGKLTIGDIHRFAALSGIKDLFPNLDDRFLRELFDSRINQAYLVKGHQYEDLSDKTDAFKQLEQAIIQHRFIHFSYKDKNYTTISPYKLVNQNGIWYLAAKDASQLKTFCFSKINNLKTDAQRFESEAHIGATIEQEDSVWFSADKYEVVLKVEHGVASYFKRRNLLPNQHIDKELEDGSLIISSRIAHDEQILPLINYWLPNVHIISPKELRSVLIKRLSNYLVSNEI
ncbi:MAG: WYL domain-containing protein [Methylococcales bacterium]|nr:WYL domain-containing protein [Methylococcales bacterium]